MQRLRDDPYALGALGYLAYGVVYFVGAVLELTPERQVAAWGVVPWWLFYVVGALLVLVLPYLVWRRLRVLTLVLWLGPAGKVLWLAYVQGRALSAGTPARAYNWLFMLVALVASLLLLRAALSRRVEPAVRGA